MSAAPPVGVCEKCGMDVSRNEEGRVTCTGCGMATDNCKCVRRQS